MQYQFDIQIKEPNVYYIPVPGGTGPKRGDIFCLIVFFFEGDSIIAARQKRRLSPQTLSIALTPSSLCYIQPVLEGLTFKDTMNCFSSKSSLLSALLALSCSIISCRLLALLCRGGGVAWTPIHVSYKYKRRSDGGSGELSIPRRDDLHGLYDLYDLFPLQFMI